MTRGPRTPAHRLRPEAVDGLAVGVGYGGVVIAFRPDGEPVAVQLFRNRPTQVVAMSTGYTARLLAFRALAVGAAVDVVTGTAGSATTWAPLLALRPPAVPALAQADDPMPGASPRRPALRCETVAPGAASPWPGLAAWQTRVAVSAALPPATAAGLTAFDLVLLSRLAPASVRPVQLAFDLPDAVADQLPRLPHDSVVAIAEGRAMVLSLGLTSVERTVLGPPTS